MSKFVISRCMVDLEFESRHVLLIFHKINDGPRHLCNLRMERFSNYSEKEVE